MNQEYITFQILSFGLENSFEIHQKLFFLKKMEMEQDGFLYEMLEILVNELNILFILHRNGETM